MMWFFGFLSRRPTSHRGSAVIFLVNLFLANLFITASILNAPILTAHFFAFLGIGKAQAAGTPLVEARQAYVNEDFRLAKELYSQILPADPEWDEKLEDSIRWLMKERKFESAWRITQLAKRTQRNIPNIAYYEKLAALKFGACSFGSKVLPLSWDLLFGAYGARFYQRFSKVSGEPTDSSGAADRGVQVSLLADFALPFLRDLKKTYLIRNRGCRFNRPEFANRNEAEEAELDFLRRYLDWVSRNPQERLEGENLVKIRILRLSEKLRYDELTREIQQYFRSLSPDDWAKIEDPERLYVWTSLRRSGLVSSGFLPVHSREHTIVKKILESSKTAEAASWLSTVEFDKWSYQDRLTLFQKLESIKSLPKLEDITLRRAIMFFEKGKDQQVILLLKQIFDSSDASEYAKQGALVIIERLFSKYQFNSSMLGAIQVAAPGNLWPRIYQGLLIDHSLRGNLKAFASIKSLLLAQKRRRGGSIQVDADIQVFERLANRRINDFQRAIEVLYSTNRRHFVTLAASIALRSEGLSEDEFLKVESATRIIAKKIRDDMDSGRADNSWVDLLSALERKPLGMRGEAEKAAQGGVSHAGSVNIRPIFLLQNPFSWTDVLTVPPRDLLAVPFLVGDRKWHLE